MNKKSFRKVLSCCQRGQWDLASETLKVSNLKLFFLHHNDCLDFQTVEVMIADKELERKVLNDTVDSQTGNTVNKYALKSKGYYSYGCSP